MGIEQDRLRMVYILCDVKGANVQGRVSKRLCGRVKGGRTHLASACLVWARWMSPASRGFADPTALASRSTLQDHRERRGEKGASQIHPPVRTS